MSLRSSLTIKDFLAHVVVDQRFELAGGWLAIPDRGEPGSKLIDSFGRDGNHVCRRRTAVTDGGEDEEETPADHKKP